jgi:hypothetical protein
VRLEIRKCVPGQEAAAPTKALQIHYTNNDGGVCVSANTQAESISIREPLTHFGHTKHLQAASIPSSMLFDSPAQDQNNRSGSKQEFLPLTFRIKANLSPAWHSVCASLYNQKRRVWSKAEFAAD